MFTPIHSLLGADLLHLSTSHHLELTGRPLGISGILNGAVLGDRETWRWAFIAGLVGSAVVGNLTSIAEVGWGVHRYGLEDGLTGGSISRRVLAGVLVGFGSKLGSGCTSGHFLCGMSRLSPRSIVASITFFLTATLISNVFPHPAFNTDLPRSDKIGMTLPDLAPSWSSAVHLVPIALRLFHYLDFLLPGLLKRIQGRSRSQSTRSPETNTDMTADTATDKGTRTAEVVLSFFSGLTFGTGLLMSGMVSPSKTLGFMRLPFLSILSRDHHSAENGARGWSEWDPSLAMVILAAVLPNMRHWLKKIKPRVDKSIEPKLYQTADQKIGKSKVNPVTPGQGQKSRWQVPLGKAAYNIDSRLIIGSIVFGLGWGLGGVCPGPALVRLGLDGAVRAEGWTFIASVLFGMKLAGFV
ncbi:hypothetical protein FFLO_05333 [Filobasidium floriforme]|uniref:Sulphur transport domain-containing protein n=1 Tax=Filobasidium floriforme TaxID=5210 RepID=A0A8K0JH18_9TREE|nr:hypothetical protein FFLO_05333 [Filobasidium floriforme]